MILNKYDEKTVEEIAACYRRILKLVGEDPSREGLLKTPVRAAKAIMDITRGYREDPEGIVRSAIFEHSGSQVVTVKDIEFYSVCEHHILPFFGRISIGYVPDGHIVGLSKLARIVDVYAHRLQVQERLTGEICSLLTRTLTSKGVIVVCQAGHLCMKMRGVEKQDSTTVTMDFSGAFADDASLRREFLDSLR